MKEIKKQEIKLQLSDEYQENTVLQYAVNVAVKHPVNTGIKNSLFYMNEPISTVYQKERECDSMAGNEKVHIMRKKNKNMKGNLFYVCRKEKLQKEEFYIIMDTFEYFNQNPSGTYSELWVK